MSAPLIETKLHVPRPRPGSIPRPRLLARLDAGLRRRATLVAAPAGYGKTTLVAAWLQQLREEDGRPVAWVSLDADDNDPRRFLRYLFAAVNRALPETDLAPGPFLGDGVPADSELLVEALLNAVTGRDRELLLVLDDYHTILSQEIHAAVTTLVDYLPPHAHLLLTVRHDPPLPLPRWRVRSQLNELRAADLRFTRAEAAAFLRETMQVDLEETLVEVLEERTEGWVAGLQLAALSLRHQPDARRQIDAFGGSDRHVADYLLTEVLDRQSPARRRFLLQTSILDRFTAGLCDRLLETGNSHAVLDGLESDNLFLVPLDNQRRWYRYHHLFADLLRRRLEQAYNRETIRALHRRAAAWYAKQEQLPAAIHHALSAGDSHEAARLVATVPLYTFWQGSADLSLRHYVDQLPKTALRAHPYAAVVAAGIHLLAGDRDRLDDFLGLVADEPSVRGERALLRAILVRNEGDNRGALALAREAADTLPGRDPMLEAMAQTQIAVNLEALGQTTAARQVLEALRGRRQPRNAQEVHVDLQVTWLLALLNRSQARLQQADRLAREGLSLLEQRGESETPTAGLLLGALGDVHYLWNELDEATGFYNRALAIGRRTPITDILINARMGLINLACARGDGETVRRHVDTLLALIRRSRFEEIVSLSNALVARFDLRLGALPRAQRWADGSGLALDDAPANDTADLYYSLALVRAAEARELQLPQLLDPLTRMLRRLVALAEASEHWVFHLRLQLLLAQVLEMRDRGAGVSLTREAVERARPAGIIRVFADYGEPLRPLLRQVLAAGVAPGYVRRLLLALGEEVFPAGFDPLTDRETEVLVLLTAGLTNRQIEAELVISENTVRTHLKNLYSKLDVHDRHAAVERARALGLLK